LTRKTGKTTPTVQRYPFEPSSSPQSSKPSSVHFNTIWFFLIGASAIFAFTFASSDELDTAAGLITVSLTGLNLAYVKRRMNHDLIEWAIVLTALPAIMVVLIAFDRHLN